MGDPEKIDVKDWKSMALSWIFSQGVSTVMLVAIFAVLCYGGNYAMTVAIPAHLTQIQAGYDKAAVQNKEALKDQQAMFERALKQVTDACEREMQLLERRTSSVP